MLQCKQSMDEERSLDTHYRNQDCPQMILHKLKTKSITAENVRLNPK